MPINHYLVPLQQNCLPKVGGIYQLAEIFNKTNGAIQSRLKHLNDPKHKAHQRLFKKYGIMATGEHDGNTILDKAVISEE